MPALGLGFLAIIYWAAGMAGGVLGIVILTAIFLILGSIGLAQEGYYDEDIRLSEELHKKANTPFPREQIAELKSQLKEMRESLEKK
jgi:hypothetical protein